MSASGEGEEMVVDDGGREEGAEEEVVVGRVCAAPPQAALRERSASALPQELTGLLAPAPAPAGRRWVSDSLRYKQLGNAVCVPVVRAVAQATAPSAGDCGGSAGVDGIASQVEG